ncbi:alkaline phosphatase [Segnochrobactrum spirostomi]|uniref:Alkaline phosphatase n=1 Tax=Segnochrobactrum spirostomi TaxID=2608987 RepID=A0A6A7Y2X5_9HYPH|nr:alkaline phosphatase [Segnochrobactrum spirostomi]MQT13106.1 alkaline phosphatase [Segnochrobactrum spirostomi]
MRQNWLALAAVALIPGVAFAQSGETRYKTADDHQAQIYPIDRATLLSGGKFDFKVEFPTVVKPEEVQILINGQDYKTVFGKEPTFIEKENGADASSIVVKDVAIAKPGTYTIEAKAGGAEETVKWDVFGTPKQPAVKNVIFLLGDGMTVSMRTGARIMSKGNTQGKANGLLNMDTLPAMAFIGTSSTDSIAADSANTMSAYMTGQKSAVNALGVYASRAKGSLDQPHQETIAEVLRRVAPQKSIGVVSNAEIEDATPAAVVSHTRRRADKPEIVGMFYAVKPEVILGGGSAYFLPKSVPGSKRKDDTDYVAQFKDAGYQLVTTKTELEAAPKDGKLLGLFHTGNMDGTLDQKVLHKGTVAKFPDQPDVPDMMQAALDVLSKDPDGFFLMVEGAEIDKNEHPMDWDRALFETITFDKAVGIAKKFAETHPDTLIIVTADHTHGASLIGTIDYDKPGTEMREKVGTYQDAGFPTYVDANGDGYPDSVDVSRRLAVFANNFPDYYETFRPHLEGQNVPAVKNEKGEYVANEAYKDVPGAVLRIGNLPKSEDTAVHAVDDVVLQAQGPGSEKFHGYMENTDVFRVMTESLALGVEPAPTTAQ